MSKLSLLLSPSPGGGGGSIVARHVNLSPRRWRQPPSSPLPGDCRGAGRGAGCAAAIAGPSLLLLGRRKTAAGLPTAAPWVHLWLPLRQDDDAERCVRGRGARSLLPWQHTTCVGLLRRPAMSANSWPCLTLAVQGSSSRQETDAFAQCLNEHPDTNRGQYQCVAASCNNCTKQEAGTNATSSSAANFDKCLTCGNMRHNLSQRSSANTFMAPNFQACALHAFCHVPCRISGTMHRESMHDATGVRGDIYTSFLSAAIPRANASHGTPDQKIRTHWCRPSAQLQSRLQFNQ